MPRNSDNGPSNGDIAREAEIMRRRREGVTSAGTSSSTSESRPEPSGSSAPEMESITPSPARSAGSRSGTGRRRTQAPSSSASSTGGSTPVTGPSPQSPPDSSGESAPQSPVTPANTEGLATDGWEALSLAREAVDDGDFDLAEDMLKEAEGDPELAGQVELERARIRAARGE
jgi:hypothetical protein